MREAALGRGCLEMAGGLGRQLQRQRGRRRAKAKAEPLYLPVHIVGGRGDDWVPGNAFGVPAKAKKKPETRDSLAGLMRFVDFCGSRPVGISFAVSSEATEASPGSS